MERSEKGDPAPFGAASHAVQQQQRPVQYPPPPGGYYPPPAGSAYYPSPASGFVANQPPPSAYQQQQTTGVVVVGSAPPASQSVVVVQTVRANVQIPDVYPGIAFCQFAPGIIETLIRASIVVMLLVVIGVAGATIEAESEIIYYDEYIYFDPTGWQIAAGWIIFAAGLSLITEGIMLFLRFVNPKCFNNSYGIFGGLDITKCVLSGIGLFIGCVITGVESAVAADDVEEFCDTEARNPDNDDACEQLDLIRRMVIALTAVNVVCMALILALFTWDIIYLSAGFNSRIPVPRGTEEQQH